MGAAQEGAGRERSFGLNIRLPFEQDANPWIADDPKLITFKYFFTRKLFLVREAQRHGLPARRLRHLRRGVRGADADPDRQGSRCCRWCCWTSRAAPTGRRFAEFIRRGDAAATGMISAEDLELFRVTDDVEEAAAEIEGFYRVYHSQRYLGDGSLLRCSARCPSRCFGEIGSEFADVLSGPVEQTAGPVKGEDDEFPDLPRLSPAIQPPANPSPAPPPGAHQPELSARTAGSVFTARYWPRIIRERARG